MIPLWSGSMKKDNCLGSNDLQQTETCRQEIKSRASNDITAVETSIQHEKPLPLLSQILTNTTQLQLFASWRQATFFWANIVLVTLVINTAVVIWTHLRANSESGLTVLYRGDCGRARTLDTWVHLAINVISTLLLSGSNYTMQILVGPSRQEIDLAHKRGRWLDIGVPSIRNLRNIARWRAFCWMALGLSSIPLHLMFNSAFYSTMPTNDYHVLVVKEQFLTGVEVIVQPSQLDKWTKPISQATVNQLQTTANTFDRLSNTDCLTAYGTNIMDTRRNLIVVASDSIFAESPLLWHQEVMFKEKEQEDSWICEDPNFQAFVAGVTGNATAVGQCLPYFPQLVQNASAWSPAGYHAKYCLSERASEHCTFNANIPIIVTVLACNFIKVVAMFCTIAFLRCEPLLVIGDAIQSFLTTPDNTTVGLSLLSRPILKKNGYIWPSRGQRVPASPQSKQFFPVKGEPTPGTVASAGQARWSHAPSGRRWFVIVFTTLACLVMVVTFFCLAVSTLDTKTWSSLWRLGFGKVHTEALVYGADWLPSLFGTPGAQIMAAILMANIPQLILSFFYVNINGVLTTIFLADEWSDFAIHRKTLRVSWPEGKQRSTYFLQLPYKIAIPMLVTSMLLHWMVSQSIFLAVISSWTPSGTLRNVVAVATCGFSPIAMLCVLVIGVVVVIVLILVGTRRYNSYIPLASSCSAAISAACHSPHSDVDAAYKPLQWGVVSDFGDDNEAPHCCFSSEPVGLPQTGQIYY